MAARKKDLRDELGALLTGSNTTRPIRPEILASWRRVASNGLTPERFAPTYDPDLDPGSKLMRAALPVVRKLSENLAGTTISLLLTDEHAHVVGREVSDKALLARLDDIGLAPGFFYSEESVGTNAMGSALVANEPVLIEAGEHFAEPLTKFTCAGAPITDPSGGQVVGVIDLTVAAENAHPLLLPLAKQAAWEIEQRLLGDTSPIGHLLHEQFEAARRRARGPLVLVGPYTMVTNAAAAGTVDVSDGPLLWEAASRAIRGGARTLDHVLLASGVTVGGDVQTVEHCGQVVGALVWLRTEASVESAARSGLGLSVLTQSERGLADLVAAGLTNREVANQLFVSPYTVDAHLRHIFRKLNIRSRVELARMVAAHS